MVDDADERRRKVERVPRQRGPHADKWLGRAVADAADAPEIAGSPGGGAGPAAESAENDE